MTKQQLEYFLSAAEFCNLSRAAAFHYVSIPTFTRHINDLEAELSTKLFSRNNRGLTLTASGALFHPFAMDTLTRMYEYYGAVEEKGLLVGEPRDEFTMGYYPYGGMFAHYAALIDRYLNIWIKKPCALRCVKGGSMTEMVRTGKLDVGAVSDSRLEKYGDIFESRVFFRSKCTMLVENNHELSGRDSITVAEIAEKYSEFDRYLPGNILSDEMRLRKIRNVKDIVTICRMFLEYLPAWSALRDADDEAELSGGMIFVPSGIQRPELSGKHALQIEGGDVTMTVRLFWLRDNDDPAIRRFKDALDFAEIK